VIKSLVNQFRSWFKETTVWWFTTLFGRIGILFSIAAIVLVLVTYYVINWGYTGRDDILDAHDAYHYNKLVDSWGSPPNISLLSKELENLKLKCSVFVADQDTACLNDTLVFWSNHTKPISLCNYLSYASAEDYAETHNILYSNYVSFGDVEFDDNIVQATFVHKDNYKYLITLDIPPSSPPTFSPFIILAFLSLSVLYLITRRFLRPISLIEKRIIALERGDLDSTLPVVGRDELAVLSKNFNTMVGEIKNLLRQKERLLSDVSHELRTPLAKIRLMLALMPEHKKVKDVDKQIKVLDSLITNILLSDQMSAPYSNLNNENVSVSKLISGALELTFVENVEIIKDDNVDDFISVDSVKMSIAIKNLIENAYKYADNDEKIKVFIGNTNKYTTVLVKDRGPGIPEDLIKNITKAFVRGKNETESGFGLGLSICYKVISAHGGRLEIQNNPRGGASFTLCIPKK
tara:strand:+ start:51 stop:1439 length:1389 start_codon:yes stop_codon:yes gene_type:complete